VLRTNASELVETAVYGQVWPPAGGLNPYQATSEGKATVGLGMAGISFTNRVGDPAFGWEADHLEPGVSIRNPLDGEEHALHYLACIGNDAVVTSGACAGARGVVTGEHAHVLVDFPPESIELLAHGDRIQIRALGTGLRLLDHADVALHKCSPRLLEALRCETLPDGTLSVPVVTEIPSHLMGSGAELTADYVDQDFMTGDRGQIAELGLDQLRLGDVVVVRDQDHTWGRGFYRGAVSIGLIIHGDSAWTGHGPGVLDLMSSRTGGITPVTDVEANIAWRLGLRDRSDAVVEPRSITSSYALFAQNEKGGTSDVA
jgi:hypothetical protein